MGTGWRSTTITSKAAAAVYSFACCQLADRMYLPRPGIAHFYLQQYLTRPLILAIQTSIAVFVLTIDVAGEILDQIKKEQP